VKTVRIGPEQSKRRSYIVAIQMPIRMVLSRLLPVFRNPSALCSHAARQLVAMLSLETWRAVFCRTVVTTPRPMVLRFLRAARRRQVTAMRSRRAPVVAS
jgi:hypothetical protein